MNRCRDQRYSSKIEQRDAFAPFRRPGDDLAVRADDERAAEADPAAMLADDVGRGDPASGLYRSRLQVLDAAGAPSIGDGRPQQVVQG